MQNNPALIPILEITGILGSTLAAGKLTTLSFTMEKTLAAHRLYSVEHPKRSVRGII